MADHDLHNAIMNIPACDPGLETSPERAYKLGHRDARHAAAELALAFPPVAVQEERDASAQKQACQLCGGTGGHWEGCKAPLSPKCLTCGGSGCVGGPSFYNPGEGGEPCTDCAPIEPLTKTRGYHALVQVIYELQQDGQYSDEEGEETAALAELLSAIEKGGA